MTESGSPKGYKVLIRKNETGEIREHVVTDFEWEDHVDHFMWLDGNYACDCNRELFFERAGGNDEIELEDVHCSDNRFTAIKAILPDGREIELDAGGISETY